MKLSHSLNRALAAFATAVLIALGMGVAPAQAATTTVSGTVNCNGSSTYYSTVRYMAEPARTELYLTKAAGGARSGYSMIIGIEIVATGKDHAKGFVSANWWGTFQSGVGYVKNTRFRMFAQMAEPSAGACSNTWSGDLYY